MTTRRRFTRPAPADEPDEDRILAGDPEQIAATIAELEEVGVTHLIVEIPGETAPELLENLDWFGREVLAHA